MSTLQLIAVCVNKLNPKDFILRLSKLCHLWHKEMGTNYVCVVSHSW